MRYLDVWVHGEPCQWKLEKVEGELTHFRMEKDEEYPKKGDAVRICYAGHELEGSVFQVYGNEVFVYLPITFHPETVLGERRVFVRYSASIPAVIFADNKAIGCEIKNMSLSGCQIELLNPSDWLHMKMEQTILLKCDTEDLQMDGSVEIKRISHDEKRAELGVRFVEMDAHSFSDIRKFILEEQRKELERMHPSFVQKILSWLA